MRIVTSSLLRVVTTSQYLVWSVFWLFFDVRRDVDLSSYFVNIALRGAVRVPRVDRGKRHQRRKPLMETSRPTRPTA